MLNSIKKEKWSILLISLVTVISFSPVFFNGFVEWDDWHYITHNALIKSLSFNNFWIWFTRPLRGLYQPLIQFSFALNYAIDGLNPTIFHTTNLLIHTANSVLVFYFIMKLSKNRFVAILSAILFAVHPLHVESVAWATERKDTLYAFFFLAGLIYYQRYTRENTQKLYNLTFLMLGLSLLSKGSAVVFPVVLVLIDFVQKRKWYSQKILLEKAPFFILAVFYGLLTFWFHYHWGAARNHTGLL
jgi:4-amino-4-deoxy-L-arabinose transferase-like glycosyltransferase